MIIRLECECGCKIQIGHSAAGKRGTCQGCGRELRAPDTDFFVVYNGERVTAKTFRDWQAGRAKPAAGAPASGAAPPAPVPAREGRPSGWTQGKVVAGEYEVVQGIGRGAMASVFLLRNRRDKTDFVAAKVPNAEFAHDERLRELYSAEVENWIELGDYPHIVRADRVLRINYLPVIFMEYCDGGTVKDHLKAADDRLPLEEALGIAIQMSWGMDHAHSSDRVHRDLKASNVLLLRDGTAKVSDFGLARCLAVDTDKTGARQAGGSSTHMAPEQWEDFASAGKKADIYAFGVTLYRLVCGSLPLHPATHPRFRDRPIPRRALRRCLRALHLEEEPLPPEREGETLPEPLPDLIRSCLEKDPEQRPADFEQIAEALIEGYRAVAGREYERTQPTPLLPGGGTKHKTATSLLTMGQSCELRGDLDKAEQLYNRALALFNELDDEAGQSSCLLSLGFISHARGDFPKAKRLFQQSLEAKTELEDQPGILKCHLGLGLVLSAQDDHDGALDHYQRSLTIASELDDRRAMADCYLNMGMVCHAKKDYNRALAVFRKGLAIQEKLNSLVDVSKSLLNLGAVFRAMHEPGEALRNYEKSLAIKKKLGDRPGIATCYLNMGNVLSEDKKYTNALKYYQDSLKLRQELGDRAGAAVCYRNLGATYEKLRDRKRTLEAWEKYHSLCLELGLAIPSWLTEDIEKLRKRR